MVPWGYVAALQCDPTEKKPFYHFLPGSDTLTFGMLGCDFHCSFCQNWLSSQTLRDPAAAQGVGADHQLRGHVAGAHILCQRRPEERRPGVIGRERRRPVHRNREGYRRRGRCGPTRDPFRHDGRSG